MFSLSLGSGAGKRPPTPDGATAARFRPRTTPDDPAVLAAIKENLPA